MKLTKAQLERRRKKRRINKPLRQEAKRQLAKLMEVHYADRTPAPAH